MRGPYEPVPALECNPCSGCSFQNATSGQTFSSVHIDSSEPPRTPVAQMASAPCGTDAFIAIAAQFKLDRRSLGFLQRLRRKNGRN